MIETPTKAAVRSGASELADSRAAAAELCERIAQTRCACVVFFASPRHDLEIVGKEVEQRFPGVPVIGGTTAGEISGAGYLTGTLVGFSLGADEFSVATRLVTNLRDFGLNEGREIASELCRALTHKGARPTPANAFGLLLIDGLSMQEEMVVSALSRGLEGIHFVGGSVADGTRFERTWIWHQGSKRNDCAVLTLVRSELPFYVFKTEHFVASDQKMVVTKADPVRRIVYEIDGVPANVRYAELLRIPVAELASSIYAAHPVVMRMGGAGYVRSVQRQNADGSLSFLCSIDVGVVLSLAKSVDILEDLERTFALVHQRIGRPELVIGCDCILRSLELDHSGKKAAAAAIFAANRVLGFSTYGEQLDWMHVNQTFTGIAIGGKRS